MTEPVTVWVNVYRPADRPYWSGFAHPTKAEAERATYEQRMAGRPTAYRLKVRTDRPDEIEPMVVSS